MADVIELITNDHREVEDLFQRFRSGDRSVVEKICEELDRHTRGEDQAVYPVVREDVGGAIIDDAEREHKEARQLIGRIKSTADERHIAELVDQLEQAVQHHVREEESEMLPKMRRELNPDRLEQLGSAFEEAKRQATT